MWPVVVVFVIAVLVIIATQWIRRWMNPRCNNGVLPPGSMGWPLIGETLQLFIPSRSMGVHPFIKKRISKYGPIFRTSIAARPIVVSADPKVNHFILSQEGKSVEMWYLDSFSKIFNQDGESRITAVGKVHKYIRSTYLNFLGVEAIKEKLLPQLEEMACRALESWSNQECVEVKSAAATIIFSYEFENSSENLADKLTNIIEGLMSFPLNVPGTAFHECMKIKKKIMGIIKKKFNEKRVGGPKTAKVDLLDQVIQDMTTEKFFGEEFVLHMIFGALFASFETNSSTLTFALLMLSQHPSALEKLTDEHETIMRNRKNMNSSLTWDEYKSMTFTLQVIKETLRLANNSPGLLRKALKDIQVNGYTIPAGWTIMVASSAQHLNPNVFDDELEFNPWRWKDIDKNAVEQNFMPFGGGMRQCAGAEFSKALISTFLHVFVTKYRFTVVKIGDIKRSPLLSFGDGVHIKISKKE